MTHQRWLVLAAALICTANTVTAVFGQTLEVVGLYGKSGSAARAAVVGHGDLLRTVVGQESGR
jgi:hypothetical protein